MGCSNWALQEKGTAIYIQYTMLSAGTKVV